MTKKTSPRFQITNIYGNTKQFTADELLENFCNDQDNIGGDFIHRAKQAHASGNFELLVELTSFSSGGNWREGKIIFI